MNRIDKKFRKLRKLKKKAFIVFITAGYPSLDVTYRLVLELSKIGVDIIELGVPFSDPMADGPVIQESSQVALKKKTHLIDILRLVKKCRKATDVPIALMTYYNPIFCFNEEKFVQAAEASGVDGIIVPDLPPEEAEHLIKLSRKTGLATIFFISPTTSAARAKFIANTSRGFIYYVSLTGTTGSRRNLASDLSRNLKAIKSITKKPVCVGFGISTREQVKEASRISDGVIVGSAVVKKIKENLKDKSLVKKVASFVNNLKA